MQPRFSLSCESTVDMPYALIAQREIPVLFYSYTVDDQVYPDDMGRDPEALPRFYQMLSNGKIPSTSQLNEFQYEAFFEELLQQGDVLHITFGSGMTGSYQNAEKAAALLRQRYPERTIQVIDSLCSSSGYGLLVDMAADMRDQGATLEDTAQWVLDLVRVHLYVGRGCYSQGYFKLTMISSRCFKYKQGLGTIFTPSQKLLAPLKSIRDL